MEERERSEIHEPESKVTQTAESRLREENKETDEPEIVLDGHAESYDKDR